MNRGIDEVRTEALGLMRKMVLGTNSPKMRIIRVAMSVWTVNSRASLLIHGFNGAVSNCAIAIE